LRDKLDPKKSNGGVLLGLNGVVVKSHGGTDAEGFAYAVDVGYEMARYEVLTKINQMLNREGGALAAVPAEAVS
jgi:glycerol-3-phosphate acyltransferase PlsX